MIQGKIFYQQIWNSLSDDVVLAPSINSFKAKLDKFLVIVTELQILLWM